MQKQYKSFIVALIFLFILGWSQASLSAPPAAAASKSKPINHIVIIWMKDPKDSEAKKRFFEASKSFSTIPGVINHSVGEMLASDRAVVDSSYDLAIVVTLKDQQALADYLKNPIHKKVLEETLKPMVKKVLIYDSVIQ